MQREHIYSSVREIEERLCTPEFREVPMGHTLALSLFGAARSGIRRGNGSGRSELANRLWMWRHWAFPRRGDDAGSKGASKGRVLVTWLADTPRVNGLIEPILDVFGEAGCLVVCGSSAVRRRLRPGFESILWGDEMVFDVARWRSDYSLWWPRWKNTLRYALRDSPLPSVAFWHTAMVSQRQTQRVAACFDLLERIKPGAIVTEHDRNANWSCLILAARALGIPTFTLMHGVTERGHNIPFVPVLADRVLCWGNLDLRDLTDAGVSPERLIVVGNPRLSRDLNASPSESRAKAGLDIVKPVVILASHSARDESKSPFIEQFCVAMRRIPDCSPVVRLHPVDTLEDCEGLARRFPEVVFLENRIWTLDEAVAAATVVVVHSSGFGCDAVVKGCPIVVFDVISGRSLGHIEDVIKITGCPRVCDGKGLVESVNLFLLDSRERRQFPDLAEKFAAEFCGSYGNDATMKVVKEVTRAMEEEQLCEC